MSSIIICFFEECDRIPSVTSGSGLLRLDVCLSLYPVWCLISSGGPTPALRIKARTGAGHVVRLVEGSKGC